MKSILKKSAVLSILSVLLITLIIPVFAHPGSLDWEGGHYDRNSGEYHYHHGYSAHQHTNGECPYDFKDNANTEYNPNNNSSSSSSSYKPSEPQAIEQTTKINNYNSSFHENAVPLIIGIALGLPFSLFAAWSVFVFLFSCVRAVSKKEKTKTKYIEKTESKTTVSQSIHQDNEIIAQNIPLPEPQQSNTSSEENKTQAKQLTDISSEQATKIKREKVFNELIAYSISDLVGVLPEGIQLDNNLELIFPRTRDNIYGKYTIYIEKDSFIIHRKYNCTHSIKQAKLSFDYSINSRYSLCTDCWTEQQRISAENLFMPEWYKHYKAFFRKAKKYDYSVNTIMNCKDMKLFSLLIGSELKQWWKPNIHINTLQMKKIYKAKFIEIITYNPETKEAKIQGSNGNIYTTSFTSCTCKDFTLHNIPCKHIYKLAAEYGGIDFSKYI